MRKVFIKKIFLLNLICSLIVFNACGPNCPEDPDCTDIINTSFNYEDEKNLGIAIHDAMINSDNFNIMTDAIDKNNYIKSVRIQLIATGLMDRLDDFDWNIYVILNDNILDCFTTVGGNIYIYLSPTRKPYYHHTTWASKNGSSINSINVTSPYFQTDPSYVWMNTKYTLLRQGL